MPTRRSHPIVVSQDVEVVQACRMAFLQAHAASQVRQIVVLDEMPDAMDLSDWVVLDLDFDDLSSSEWTAKLASLAGQIILTGSDPQQFQTGSLGLNSSRQIDKSSLGQELGQLLARRSGSAQSAAKSRRQVVEATRTGPRHDSSLSTASRIAEFARQIASLDSARVVGACLEELPTWSAARYVSVYELQDDRQTLALLGKTHPYPIDESVDLTRQPRQPMNLVVESGSPIHVRGRQDVVGEVAATIRQPRRRRYATGAFVIAPITVGDKLTGILNLADPTDRDGFDEPFLSTLDSVCGMIGGSLSNAKLFQLVQEQAQTDGLTGLANRRAFASRLNREVMRAQRYGTALSLAMIDLDGLKDVNDTYGHTAGDAAIRETALRIAAAIREIDMAARYGGDEFAIVLPNTTLNQAQYVTDRLIAMMQARPCQWQGKEIDLTMSVGVCQYEDQPTATDLIRDADSALYDAKAHGKNRVNVAPDRPQTHGKLKTSADH